METQMTGLIKCSRCGSHKLPEFFAIKKMTGQRFKTCVTCKESAKKNWPCNQCELKSCSRSSLAKHIKSVHDKIKDLACTECEMKFSVTQNLQRYFGAVHQQVKDKQCPEC